MSYERRHQPVLSRRHFVHRMAWHILLAVALLVVAMAIGTVGFHFLDQRSMADAILNAAMLLGGMGPVGDFNREAGKYFGTFFALFAGIVYVGITGLILAPVAHRILHRLQADERD